MNASTLKNVTQLTGRALMAAIFLVAGYGKLGAGYAGTQGYMEAMGVPGALLPLVVVLELGGGLALLLGWQTRMAALLLAGFSVVSALIFHADFSDPMQSILFMKNLAMAGGLLFLVAGDTHAWSLDARGGPFVMNTREEIRQAQEDFEQGRLG
ncbi:MAG TPA: DoxX family membrane protein [Gammaproteobacteria bacterium]|nr:DoxX family membrane protein [Gammaproteobacteria bacterium]